MKLKELFKIVQQELIDLHEDAQDIRLEQVEFKENENLWEVVVSYLLENKNKPLQETKNLLTQIQPTLSSLPFERIYKLVKIDENNNIKGLYIFKKS